MVELVEGRLTLSFADEWQAIDFDHSLWHTKQMKSTLKAMDILAVNNQQHWWVEIKDCIGFEAENAVRLNAGDPQEVQALREELQERALDAIVSVRRSKAFIVEEIMQKFRDTVASVVIAQRASDMEIAPYTAPMQSTTALTVVLLLTWDLKDYKRLARLLQQKLNNALAPYGIAGYVINEHVALPGFNVTVTRTAAQPPTAI